MPTPPAPNAQQFLLALADLVEQYDAQFYYTVDDDGIHISVDGKDCFVDHNLDPAMLRAAAS